MPIDMFKNLIQFEWLFFFKKKSFYAMLAFYVLLGFMAATAANFPFPNTYKNSPYVLNYLLGIMSLMAIFSTTILAAQSLFREQDANFDTILFATPLRKTPYVISRFLIIFSITTCCFFIFLCGLMAGQLMESGGNEEFTKFNLWHYLQPFLLLLVPNILFCTAVACAIGLVTRNKMLVYVSGIFIYFLYWGVSLFTNSPLMAGAAPISAAAMNWSAKLDPFGLAAFFEQTRYWAAAQRNSQLLQLTGNLLINRTLYLMVSALLLAFAYRKFSFAIHQSQKSKSDLSPTGAAPQRTYQTILTRTRGIAYDLKSIWSLTKIDWLNIVKSVPLWVICIGWTGFLAIEIFSTIDGNTRMPERFASTKSLHPKIDELFKQIVSYDLSLKEANAAQNADGNYTLDIDASAVKFIEDGKGKNESILFTEPIEAAIFFENNKKQVVILKADENQVKPRLVFPDKPLKVVLDPEGKFLDRSEEDNKKNV
jgi:ABC-2 type transport system permease protein